MRARTAASRSLFIALTLTMPLVGAACEGTDCADTTMEATAAEKVSLQGGVLQARLTSEGVGVPGVTVEFAVLDDGTTVYHGQASTGADGRARLDLKTTLDPNALTGLVRADSWRASFDGNAAFCSSADDAPFTLLQS